MKTVCTFALSCAMASTASLAATTLYTQNFEAPTGFVNDGGDVNIFRGVNELYGGQPAGFTFAQAFTVETLLVGGTQAWGTGFLDPQKRAGSYVLGMLSDAQDDQLALAFNVNGKKFLNFGLDISSIDLDRWGGPFVPSGGAVPTFRISLYDNPGGGARLGSGTALSFAEVSGFANPLKNTFDWKSVVVALDASGATDGNVIVQFDLLSGGYAAMDNFVVAASDIAGDVPEPGTWALMLAGLAAVGFSTRRRR